MILGIACVAVVLLCGWAVAMLRMVLGLRIVVVSGPSMMPTLSDNDRVLVRRTRCAGLRRGDIALVALPGGTGTGWIIKRVWALPGDPAPPGIAGQAARQEDGPAVPAGMLALLGDNPSQSVDSRDFGYVPADRLFGVVVRKL